ITHSMSRAGKCIDNGPMEGFFGTIKVEKYYLNKYTTLDDLKNEIKEYIRFYNEERLQRNLGNRSLLEYRKFKEKMSIIELST
ncbi:MAG: integrase core domain-containing protein, partial [Fusobacterium sp.]|nr:integrase core domain-containing protein [Fusobacterium sp.]